MSKKARISVKFFTINFLLIAFVSLIASACTDASQCNFYIDPSTINTTQGAATTFNVVGNRDCGFSSAVTLSVQDEASYPFTIDFSPTTTSGEVSTGTLTIDANAANGFYEPTIVGTATGGSRQAQLTVFIQN